MLAWMVPPMLLDACLWLPHNSGATASAPPERPTVPQLSSFATVQDAMDLGLRAAAMYRRSAVRQFLDEEAALPPVQRNVVRLSGSIAHQMALQGVLVAGMSLAPSLVGSDTLTAERGLPRE
jgi:hypothetical protein